MKKLLIYSEGGTFGMGHVVRCLCLADELVRRGASVEFITDPAERVGFARIANSPYPCHDLTTDLPDGFDGCLIDVEKYPGTETLEKFKNKYNRLIIIGGVSYPPLVSGDGLCDLQIYQGELFDYQETNRSLNGTKYLIVDPAYAECRQNVDGPIVVTQGGVDPYRMTERVVMSLVGLDWRMTVIRGVAREELRVAAPENFDIINAPDSLRPYFDGASLAIVATGMSCYEALAAGVPCLLINISPDHERTAVELERRGCAWNMGQWHEFNGDILRARVLHLLAHLDELTRMGAAGRALVDGRGVGRVAEKIMTLSHNLPQGLSR